MIKIRICPHCYCDIDESGDLPPGTVSDVVAIVCERLVVPVAKVMSPDKHARVVEARNAAAALLRDLFGLSYTALGRIFERDHTTMMHAYKNADPALVRALMDDLVMLAPERNTDPEDAAAGPLRVVS